MPAFITVGRAKLTKSLSNVTSSLITVLIEAAGNIIENHLDTPVDSAERTQAYNGNGLRQLALRAIPITALGDIVIKDFAGTSTTFAGSNFDFDPVQGRISFKPESTANFDRFDAGFQNITVTYTAGFTSGNIPEAIQEATVQIVTRLYVPTAPNNPHIAQTRLGESTETLLPQSNVSTGVAHVVMTPLIEALLAPYRLTRI